MVLLLGLEEGEGAARCFELCRRVKVKLLLGLTSLWPCFGTHRRDALRPCCCLISNDNTLIIAASMVSSLLSLCPQSLSFAHTHGWTGRPWTVGQARAGELGRPKPA